MASRNRPKASARIAQQRALEARRRRRRRWLAGIAAAAVVVAAAVGITLAVNGSGPSTAGGSPQLNLASLSTLGTLSRPLPGPLAPRACRSPAPLRWPARPR